MNLSVNIYYNQVLQFINHLSQEEKSKLLNILQLEISQKQAINKGSTPLLPKESVKRKAGSMKGLIKFMADDFDAPLEDFKEYM